MSEELFARRRAKINQITEHMKKNDKVVTDAEINRIRLNAVSHAIGASPVWSNKTVSIKDNELSAEAEKSLLEEMNKAKNDLKTTMYSTGIHRFNTRGIIINDMQDEKEEQNTSDNLSVSEHAKSSYQQYKLSKQQMEEDNKIVNRHVAYHIHNTTEENQIGNETFKKMIDSTEHIRIDSQKDYLLEQHEQMYKTKEYQDIVKRRKNISMCKGTDKSLSENETNILCSILDADQQ